MVFRHLFHQPSVAEITPEQAMSKQQEGALIVDVRELYEWNEGHIPGAVHIPLASLSGRLGELDASRETITVCHSGSRSRSAAQSLQKAGFAQVNNLAGGMISWTRQRLPISTSSLDQLKE